MDMTGADVGWIEAGLDEWKPRGRWRIGNMIPAGYPCYLRIMHPAQRVDDGTYDEISWHDVAGRTGRTVSALTVFNDLIPDYDIGVGGPADGQQGEGLCIRLGEILQQHTNTPAECTFLFGTYWAGFFPEGKSMPVLTLDGQSFHVMTGSCGQACGFSVSPSAWWPADRSWIVMIPADSQSTLIGCDTQTAEQLRADPAIEAWPAKRSDSVPRL